METAATVATHRNSTQMCERALVKNSSVIDPWNEDGGTCSECSYKNVPSYRTNRGQGVLINHPERVALEVASAAPRCPTKRRPWAPSACSVACPASSNRRDA